MTGRRWRALRPGVLAYVPRVLDSPLQLFALVLGLWFTFNGVVAYGIYPDMAFGSSMHSCTVAFLGFIPVTVNGWHALFHLVTGVLALVLATTHRRSVVYLRACAPFYLVVGLLGLVGGDSVLDVMAVDRFGSIVHIVEGASMVGAVAVRDVRSFRRKALHHA